MSKVSINDDYNYTVRRFSLIYLKTPKPQRFLKQETPYSYVPHRKGCMEQKYPQTQNSCNKTLRQTKISIELDHFNTTAI